MKEKKKWKQIICLKFMKNFKNKNENVRWIRGKFFFMPFLTFFFLNFIYFIFWSSIKLSHKSKIKHISCMNDLKYINHIFSNHLLWLKLKYWLKTKKLKKKNNNQGQRSSNFQFFFSLHRISSSFSFFSNVIANIFRHNSHQKIALNWQML